jgi:mannosyltransferase OCH1-like enzyme
MFLKRIGIVWFQGEKNIKKPQFIENIHNWRIINPGWEIVILDNDMLRQICKNYSQECLDLYDSFDMMHLKIDFGRYVAMWETCGIYVDMDCYAFRSIDNSSILNNFFSKLHDNDHILGLSRTNVNILEHFISNIYLNNSIMISTVHNPIIKDLVDSIIDNNRDYKKEKEIKDSEGDYNTIEKITGPYMFSNFFKNIKPENYREKIYIEKFPYYVFEPGQLFQKFDIRDDTVAIHKYELSWMSSIMKATTKGYYNIIKPYLLVFIIFMLIIWLVYKYYYTDCKKRCDRFCEYKTKK